MVKSSQVGSNGVTGDQRWFTERLFESVRGWLSLREVVRVYERLGELV
jgi:hypothetical protein